MTKTYMPRTGPCSVDGCDKRILARGMCSTHYQRVQITGSPDRRMITIEERFWAKVDKGGPDDCWTWTGTLSRGYGWFFLTEHGPKRGIGAHRWLYERTFGPVPKGLDLDHRCHDPATCSGGESCVHRACVNPTHLEPVTRLENLRRGKTGMGAERSLSKTHCPQGHPYDEANTYHHPAVNSRSCRICNRESMRRHRAAKRARSAT